jgi:hypothetical protein
VVTICVAYFELVDSIRAEAIQSGGGAWQCMLQHQYGAVAQNIFSSLNAKDVLIELSLNVINILDL